MSDRLEQASSLVQRLDGPWDAAQVERSLARLHRRQRRRRIVRGTGLVLVLVAAGLGFTRFSGSPAVSPAVVKQEAPVLRLPDGSVVHPSSPDVVRVVEATPTSVVLELTEGHATFDVVHLASRKFVVRVGAVSIFDIGTVFQVERRAGRVRVVVEEGRVRVESPSETVELEAGESRWFSEQPRAASVPPPETGHVEVTPPRKAPPANRLPEARKRREAPSGPSHDEVEDLLVAADASRHAGRPAEAVGLLEQILSRYASDDRTPLAAFTLGKLQLEAGHHRAAADAFLAARTLAPQGPLVEDALVRELEAAQKAGDAARARSVAQDYLERFPNGARADAARGVLTSTP